MEVESEKLLERKLRSYVRLAGGISLKLPAGIMNGLPDRLCLLPGGTIFFAEIKTTKKEPSGIQHSLARKLRNMGFPVFIIDKSIHIKQIAKKYADRQI